MEKEMKKFRDFESAREFVRKLKLNTVEEWMAYCKSGDKPDDIPFSPRDLYKKEFEGYGDWLGTGNVANQKIKKQKIQSNVIQKSTSLSFRPFKEAQEFAQKLGLKSKTEWVLFSKSGNRPDDIPSSPNVKYNSKGWNGYGDWLGTGNVRNIKYQPFNEAREFARALNLKGQKEWHEYCKSGNRPYDIPAQPTAYKKDFKGYGDWLGTGNVRNIKFRPYKEAREFARALNLKNSRDWRTYSKSGDKPDDIPGNPEIGYRKQQAWKGWGDFLGTGKTRFTSKGIFRSFDESKKFVQKLGLKSQKEWVEYCASGNKPDDIPSSPYQIFANKGWKGTGDWLGTGNIRKTMYVEWRPFIQAREFVRSLGIKNYDEWFAYCKSGKKPVDIPSNPWEVYKEWNKK
jgi:hypothetical protein